MAVLDSLRSALGRRGLAIGSAPTTVVLYVLLVDVVVGAWAAIELATGRPGVRDLAVFGLLLVLAIGFEEGAIRVARLQWRLSSELKRDMTSVWAVAAAVALPAGLGITLLVGVFAHIWFRQQRGTGQPMYRTWFTMSTGLLGCVVAGHAVRGVAGSWDSLPWALASSLAVLLAIAVHTVVNRSLITGALVGVGVRGRELIGSRDDNLTELSTLCLGGLVAVAALHEPWLCLLVIAPLFALQRGAFVRELEAAAITDAKTGLLNAVAWEQLAKRELVRAERENRDLSILIIDIDRFKRVNDVFGHLVGDKVLRGIGRSLSESMRDYDGIGRFGGEEFVAVLPEADTHDTLVVAERIRARINLLTVAGLAGDIEHESEAATEPLSVSVGASVFRVDGTELGELLHAADQALYRAKHNGRNQVRLAGDSGEGTPEHVLF